MVKWSAATEKKYRVTVKPLRLEGILTSPSPSSQMVVLKVKWDGPKSAGGVLGRGFSIMRSSQPSNYSTHKFLRRRRSITDSDENSGENEVEEESAATEVEWDGEEFENVCSFGTASSSGTPFSPWDGKDWFRNTKLTTAGSISLNIAELLGSRTTIDSYIISLPISLHIHDVVRSQAILVVSVSFAEVTNGDKAPHQQTLPPPSAKERVGQTSPSDSVAASFPTQQKKRRLSFGLSWKTRHQPNPSPPSPPPPAQSADGNWEAKKELTSRDGGAKLVNGNIFLASFDQRSEKAAGESACAAVVAVIAHWLHSHPRSIPTRPQLDGLIAEGSSEWRKLCHDESHRSSFPDNHFDLDTVLANLRRPLTLSPDDSFTGIFSPEKFHNLSGATSFDEVWSHVSNSRDKVSGQREDEVAVVYIVSWNDHFFLLKVESDAYYIIDSLGERLYEGCDRAYVLKFDESAVMYEKAAAAAAEEEVVEEEGWKVVCEGKECCGEYMKRFLAAVTVGELEEEEQKGEEDQVSTLSLLRRSGNFGLGEKASSAAGRCIMRLCQSAP
ncbi:unnamed protein product [Linum tenue]|uniref:C2 NT-type domain-containing protein n=1 Tax=Linum tenue TaxID=586396 RepID=A0AAV0JYR0_9ROSI|nr:unnamed protein product [Linum tenue]